MIWIGPRDRPRFAPIAIVGRGCVLPGATSPEGLWEAVLRGDDLLTSPPEGAWGVEPERVTLAADGRSRWSDRAGYVPAVDCDRSGFAIPPESIDGLDPSVLWLLEAGRAALREAGHAPGAGSRRAGAVLGNLSLPTLSLSRFAESVWLEEWIGGPLPDARGRFMSGLPAHLLARALGLGAGAFALDAACASSLYAIRLACDALHARRADLMLAGAVNGAHPLFLHTGFRALAALSPTGQSRPFHRSADGLVPSQGAALVALKRLEDAESAGDPIFGVIRGVGLSNDGGRAGLLVPSPEGQERAMLEAYAMSGLAPADVSLIECHATGTPVGDAVELVSTGAVFRGLDGVPIGSLKSNLGHTLTASGAAGLLKVLSAIEAGVRPPMRHEGGAIDELARSPFRMLLAAEPWKVPGRRVAAVSSFGFGGNNAHVLVEEWEPSGRVVTRSAPAASASVASAPAASGPAAPDLAASGSAASASAASASAFAPAAFAPAPPAIAIVGVGVVASGAADAEGFARRLFGPASAAGTVHEAGAVTVDVQGLRFPPRDLADSLPQQVLLLRAALDAAGETETLPRERTGVYVGMQCDAEIVRHMAQLRLEEWAPAWANRRGVLLGDWLPEARAAFTGPLTAPIVLGSLPNVVANRVNVQLSLEGPSFAVSAEELSGIAALDVAVAALRSRELDAALVGAVDLCREPVQEAAARALLPPGRHVGGDAAVVLLLKRLADARRDGDHVYAIVSRPEGVRAGGSGPDAEAAWAGRVPSNVQPSRAGSFDSRAPALLHIGDGEGAVGMTPRFGHAHAASGLLHVAAAALCCAERALPDPNGARPWLPVADAPRSARVRVEALGDAAASVRVREAPRAPELPVAAMPVAVAAVNGHRAIAPPHPPVAFVFAGAAAAYPSMGSELLLANPSLIDQVARRFPALTEGARWVYDSGAGNPTALQKLAGSSFLSQVHAALSLDLLGIRPTAVLGFSSGETNGVAALGAWTEMDGLVAELEELYVRELGGEHTALAGAWGEPRAEWAAWCVRLPAAHVRGALSAEERVYLTAIHSHTECAIGGDPDACRRVLARLGVTDAIPIEYDLAAHTPAVALVRGRWRALHHRRTSPVMGVRFYSSGVPDAYEASAEAIADALTGMALTTVDFPALVERAWNDGVRVFVEHGPGGFCTRWIAQLLAGREHVAVALDRRGVPGDRQAHLAATELAAAGVPVDPEALLPRRHVTGSRATRGPAVTFASHLPRIMVPPLEVGAVQRMEPAPALPPVTSTAEHVNSATPIPAVSEVLGNGQPRHGSGKGEAPMSGDLAAWLRWRKDHVAALSATHRAFLTQQSGVQQESLAVQSNLLRGVATLAHRSGAGPRRAGVTHRAPLAPPSASTNGHTLVAASRPFAAPAPPPTSSPAPVFTRSDLERLASGRISELFGPLFREQDDFVRQVRMPMPPLLLADRVMSIHGEPASHGTGSLVTETDVRPDSWYLHNGRMPPGIQVEAGQADLLLCSWLGADLLNRGERVYRLLGCELTFHGPRPRVGETLRYDIHLDGYARTGDVRIFFFHSDCTVDGELRLAVRRGQAGFFSDEELRSSGGVLWDPASETAEPPPRIAEPTAPSTRRSFTAEQLRAFAAGRPFECFGPGFEMAASHIRSPAIQQGDMQLIDEVAAFEPEGGPWGRGYLRAVTQLRPDSWFFPGHFKDDPTMPGTLMCEAGVHAMAIHLAALGYTRDRDGWLFEPVRGVPYKMVCRGQATPASRELVTELFVHGVEDGPEPTLWADILCTVDGLKAFHGRRMGLRLTPGWPMDAEEVGASRGHAPDARAAVVDGFRFDHAALLHCAQGKPTLAFGPSYAAFDGPRRLPRLPGPPYHFMSRVTRVDGAMGRPVAGAAVEVEYDVPPDAWYFHENGAPTMPWCVLMEVALQPCGWLTAYMGVPLASAQELCFRNLDGTGTLVAEIGPASGTVRTTVTCTNVSRSGDTWIESFDVHCHVGDVEVFRMQTTFGHFPTEAMANQSGLPFTDAERAAIDVPLEARPPQDITRSIVPRLPFGKLEILDRVTGWWPEGGRAGKGRLIAEIDVDPAAWFFAAHFFQDPVQPGSLGIEAMVRALQQHMLLKRLHSPTGAESGSGGGERPALRFEPVAVGKTVTWKYRGQVVPTNRRVHVEVEITAEGRDDRGAFAVADAWLWVDGKRIYHVRDLGTRIVGEGEAVEAHERPPALDLAPARHYWARRLGVSRWPVEDLYFAMAEKFVRRVVIEDPEDFARLRGRSVLYVANHQVALESFLFTLLTPGLTGVPNLTLAKSEVRTRWLEEFLTLAEAYPGVAHPKVLVYLDQHDPQQVLQVFNECREQMIREGLSALVHVEGTRSLTCRRPVEVISSSLLDIAMGAGAPVVPVRFVGGLPVEPLTRRLHVPVGRGTQDYYYGRAILPERLAALPYAERRAVVLDALNALGPGWRREEPNDPDPEFDESVKEWMEANGAGEEYAILFRALQSMHEPGEWTRRLVDGAAAGELVVDDSPRGLWTAEMARRLFGERGPRVVVRPER